MIRKTGLKLVGSAVALALSAHAFAVTSADSSGTVFLTINDISKGTAFVYDTGLSMSSSTLTAGGYSQSLASNSNYAAFVGAESAGDVIQYSVIGANGDSTTSDTLDFTSTSAPKATDGFSIDDAYKNVNSFLLTLNNPSNGSSFQNSSTDPSTKWYDGGYEATFKSDLTVADAQSIGKSLAFYQEITNAPGDSGTNGSVSTFAGKWLLDSSGNLSYTVSAVPLPAPLLLLLSGLGSLGVIGRRRRSAVGNLDGAAA